MGNAVAKLYAITGTFGTNAKPTGTALAVSDNFDVSTLTSSLALITFQFSGANRYSMVSGTNYCLTIEYGGGNASNFIRAGLDSNSPTHAGNISTLLSGTWSGFSASDLIFYVYATQGSYALTGEAINLLFKRILSATQGSYALTGEAVLLERGRFIQPVQGSYALTG
jgi:hypothetical protein